MPDIRIGLFGGFRVEVDGRSIPEEAWRQRKPAALVKLLALAPRHRLHPEQVMELWVDVAAFRSAADRARRTGGPDVYAEAIELYRERLLPDDRYEDWAIGPRDEPELEYLALLEEQAALLESRGDVARAIRAGSVAAGEGAPAERGPASRRPPCSTTGSAIATGPNGRSHRRRWCSYRERPGNGGLLPSSSSISRGGSDEHSTRRHGARLPGQDDRRADRVPRLDRRLLGSA